MYRKFIETLKEWQKNDIQKPMMVIGVRQSGKTWILKKFCQETFGDYIYINLEEQNDMRSVFDGNLDPDTVIRGIELMLGKKIGSDVPIFLDEIQTCERAITSLKYFCEDPRDFRIICAGSLLGVKIRRFESSFPVGKVEIEYLYPMDFEEFLIACDEDILKDGIRNAYMQKKPLPEGVHKKALSLYHDYLYTGGMPESVLDYLNHDKDVMRVDHSILKNLELAYLADMTKYVTSPQESVKITETYRSIPGQLAKENPKFMYKEVRKGGNKRDFSGPLDWLVASGMIYKVDKVDAPESPLKAYDDETNFKVYLSDVGILTSLSGIRYTDLLPETNNIYKGGIIENYVYQQMKIHYSELYYFKPSATMEIDMLFDDGKEIIPVEIKAGRHRRSVSLKNYCNQYKPSYAIRLSEMNFGYENGLYSVPLYAAFCI